eukprot:scaffold5330_cov125-Isochrysis_galbana.AAC.10
MPPLVARETWRLHGAASSAGVPRIPTRRSPPFPLNSCPIPSLEHDKSKLLHAHDLSRKCAVCVGDNVLA